MQARKRIYVLNFVHELPSFGREYSIMVRGAQAKQYQTQLAAQ